MPYIIGPPRSEWVWEQQGREQVDQLFAGPPLTELDWLTFGAQADEPQAQELDCYPALPPPGYKAIASDSLGVAGLYALLGALKVPSLTQATDWRQDRLAVYMRDDDVGSDTPHALAVWRIRFQSEGSAKAYAAEIGKLGFHVDRFGPELLLSVSSNGDDEAVDMLATDACPTLQDFASAPRADTPQASLSQLQGWW